MVEKLFISRFHLFLSPLLLILVVLVLLLKKEM